MKKITSILLTFAMLIYFVPMLAFAQNDLTADTAYTETASTSVAPEGYVPENTYIEKDEDVKLFSTEDTPRVLLVEDVLPWKSSANQEVLNQLTEFDKVTTSEFLNIDLSKYGVIVFANDQPFSTYDKYAEFKEYMEVFASIGGVIVFGACDAGWSGGNLVEKLPGDVGKKTHYVETNYITDSTHPIITGSLIDNVALIDDELKSAYCSHVSFDEESLPAGSKIILRESDSNRPTLVEYPLGAGRVISSGLTWEHNYVHGGEWINGINVGYFAKIAMADMFKYAIRVSSIDVDELHQLEEWKTRKTAHSTIVVDGGSTNDNLTPIANADVKVLNNIYKTDETGQAYIENYGLQHVMVSAPGYRDKAIIYNVQERTSRMFFMEKDKGDNLPYVVQVTGFQPSTFKYIDLRDQAFHYTENNWKTLGIYVGGNWSGHGSGEFQIYQDSVNGKAGKCIRSDSGLFLFSPGKDFVPGQQIKMKIVAQDGTESEPIDLKLFVDKAPKVNAGASEMSIKEGVTEFDWIGSHKVQSDNEIFTNLLTTDMSISSGLVPVEISIEHNSDGTMTYKGTVGLAAGEGTKNLKNSKKDESKSPWDEFKNQIKDYKKAKDPKAYFSKLKNKYAKDWHPTKFRATVEAEINVLGYIEVKVDPGNTILSSDGGIIIEGGADGVFGQTFFAGPVPVYYEIKAGVGLKFDGSIEFYNENDGGLGFRPQYNGIKIEVPKISLEGGVGVRGVATVGVQGNGKFVLGFEPDNTTSGTLNFGGAIHIKVVLVVDYKWDFWNTTIKLWPKNAKELNLFAVDSMPIEDAEISFASRDYLENQSEWNGEMGISLLSAQDDNNTIQTLQEGIMPDAMPQLYQVDDDLVMLFLQDNGEETIGNHTRLVYSVYDGMTWSLPEPVWNTEGADFYFNGSVDSNNLHIAWQKSKNILDSDDPNKLLDDVAKSSEICYAVWNADSKSFESQQYLTNNSILDVSPTIVSKGDSAEILWVSNDENSILETSGDYKINSVKVNNRIAERQNELVSTKDSISEISASYQNDKLDFIYTLTDKDGNVSLYYYNENNSTEIETNYIPAGLTFADSTFSWHGDGQIYTFDTVSKSVRSINADNITNASSSYKLVCNNDKKAIIWKEANNTSSVLKASIYENGIWCKPILLLDNLEDNISYMDVVMLNSGDFVIIMNTVKLNESGEAETTALKYAVVSPQSDIELTYADADEINYESNQQTVSAYVTNNGSTAIKSVKLIVEDTNSKYLEKDISTNILPGEGVMLSEVFDNSAIDTITNANVRVEIDNDADADNNIIPVTLGKVDISLEMETYERDDSVIFVCNIANESKTNANVALSMIEDSANGIVLDVKNIGIVDNKEYVQYVYSVDKTKINFDENGNKLYFFKIESLEEDLNDVDNNLSYMVQQDPDDTIDTSIDMVVIDNVMPSKIQIKEGDVSLNLNAGETIHLHTEVFPAEAQATGAEWTVENADIVHITSDGLVTPLRAGKTTITATLTDEITDNITVEVVDDIEKHSLTVNANAGGKISTNVNGNYVAGESVTIQAEPNSGYKFVNWTSSNGGTFNDPSKTQTIFTMPANDTIITAIFEKELSTPNINSGGGGGGVTTYTVTFNTHGGSQISSVRVERNSTAAKPADPTREGYIFDGWYTNEECTTAYDFETKVTKSFTLYAKWVEDEQESTEPTPPPGPITPSGDTGISFTDVFDSDWFNDTVTYVVENGLMNGTSATEFSPNMDITRGMFVTVLYRMEGSPNVELDYAFTDVAADEYYASAVAWADDNGIVQGYSAKEYAPNQTITREQMAAIIYRYATYNGMDTSADAELTYRDAESISDYAIPAVAWATVSGIMQGRDGGVFAPADFTTRAEAAAVFERTDKTISN